MIQPGQHQGGAEIIYQRALEFEERVRGIESDTLLREVAGTFFNDALEDVVIGSWLCVKSDSHSVDWSRGAGLYVDEVAGQYAGRMACYGAVPKVIDPETGRKGPVLATVMSVWVDRFLLGPRLGVIGTPILGSEIKIVK